MSILNFFTYHISKINSCVDYGLKYICDNKFKFKLDPIPVNSVHHCLNFQENWMRRNPSGKETDDR